MVLMQLLALLVMEYYNSLEQKEHTVLVALFFRVRAFSFCFGIGFRIILSPFVFVRQVIAISLSFISSYHALIFLTY